MQLLSAQMILCALFAIVVYKFIVSKQKGSDETTDLSSYLVGFGVVIPAALYVPFCFLTALDIQSKTLSMALICLPILVTFRCLEGELSSVFWWKYCIMRMKNAHIASQYRIICISIDCVNLALFVCVSVSHYDVQQCLDSLRQPLESL